MLLSRNDYELQATACLAAAAEHRRTLESSARMLAGSDDEGSELFQEAVLRSHDTIQRYGFHGDGYQFYIWRVIKNLHTESRERSKRKKTLRADELELRAVALLEEAQSDGRDSLALADRIRFELEQTFPAADVAAFRMHVAGSSSRDIERATGRNYRTISRTLRQMKQQLSAAFRPAFENLA